MLRSGQSPDISTEMKRLTIEFDDLTQFAVLSSEKTTDDDDAIRAATRMIEPCFRKSGEGSDVDDMDNAVDWYRSAIQNAIRMRTVGP
jgi:hypothetical protein